MTGNDDTDPACDAVGKRAGEDVRNAGGLTEFGYEQRLRRSLGLWDLIVYGLVFMVPIAPFAVFGVVLEQSRGMVALTYVIGLVAMLFTAVSYQQMSRAFPIAGSVYSYAGRGVADWLGFLAGWAILLDYLLIPTLLYVLGAVALGAVLPAVPQPLWIVVFVVVNTAVNLRGIESTARANQAFLIGELVVLAVFVVAAVGAINRGVNGATWTIRPVFDPAQFSPSLVFAALSVAVLSFLGFDAISTLSEEVRGGPRMVGRATIVALCLVAGLFIGQTWLAGLLLPGVTALPDEAARDTAFYDVTRIAGGPVLLVVVTVASAVAAVANSLVAQAAVSRLLFAMSRDRVLPGFLAHLTERRRVPVYGVLLVAGLSLVLGLALVGRVELLSSLVNVGALASFLVLHVTVVWYYLIRRRSRRWLTHLIVPAAGFVIIGYVLVNADLNAKIGGTVWLLAGLIVAVVLKQRGRRLELEHPPHAK